MRTLRNWNVAIPAKKLASLSDAGTNGDANIISNYVMNPRLLEWQRGKFVSVSAGNRNFDLSRSSSFVWHANPTVYMVLRGRRGLHDNRRGPSSAWATSGRPNPRTMRPDHIYP